MHFSLRDGSRISVSGKQLGSTILDCSKMQGSNTTCNELAAIPRSRCLSHPCGIRWYALAQRLASLDWRRHLCFSVLSVDACPPSAWRFIRSTGRSQKARDPWPLFPDPQPYLSLRRSGICWSVHHARPVHLVSGFCVDELCSILSHQARGAGSR